MGNVYHSHDYELVHENEYDAGNGETWVTRKWACDCGKTKSTTKKLAESRGGR